MLILGLCRARERVCAFLLELAEWRGDCRRQPEIWLPMSRYDMADYLALAVETVSRVLTQLRLEGVIRLSGVRRVWVCDWEALESSCGAAIKDRPKRRASGAAAAALRGEITHSA